jgi:membrane protein DedA with SNARE-associated domain
MNLLSFFYQFIIGGALFFIGLIFPLLSGDFSWKKKEDRLTLIFMILVFSLYLIFQALWYLYAVGKL